MPRINGAKWLDSIFPKLVIAFLLLVTPLFGIGLIIIKLGETSIRNEVSDSLLSRVKFYVTSLETEKLHTLGLLNQLAVDKDLIHLTFVGHFMKINVWSEAVLALESKIQMIKASSIYIKNVNVHMLTQNRTISTEASITDQLSEEYEAMESIYSMPNRAFIPWENRLFLGLPFPTSSKLVKPSFAIQAEMNLTMLKNALINFTHYENSGAMLINLQQGWVVDNNRDEPQLPYIKKYLSEQINKDIWEETLSLDMGGEPYLIAYKYSEELDSYLVVYVPHNQLFGTIEVYKKLLWLLSLLSIVVILIYSSWIYRMIHRPLNRLIRYFGKLEEGQWEKIRLPRSRDEFTDLIIHYNTMVERLKVLFHEVVEQKTRAQTSELKQLQSQINPHFLYNTYFILYRLAKAGEIDNLIRFCQYLGNYFQYITRSGADHVPLESEIKHSQTYVEIQNIRFFNRIDVEFAELPDDCRNMVVPRLILQPVIENAYKHGLEKKLKDCKIVVDFQRVEGLFQITVEDNGETLQEEQLLKLQQDLNSQNAQTEYTGLLNIHRRLQIMFGEAAGIYVSRGPMGGMQVRICIDMYRNLGHSNSDIQ